MIQTIPSLTIGAGEVGGSPVAASPESRPDAEPEITTDFPTQFFAHLATLLDAARSFFLLDAARSLLLLYIARDLLLLDVTRGWLLVEATRDLLCGQTAQAATQVTVEIGELHKDVERLQRLAHAPDRLDLDGLFAQRDLVLERWAWIDFCSRPLRENEGLRVAFFRTRAALVALLKEGLLTGRLEMSELILWRDFATPQCELKCMPTSNTPADRDA